MDSIGNTHNCSLALKDNRYIYMGDYNLVVNPAVLGLLEKHGENKKIPLKDVPVDESTIKKKVKKVPQLIFEITENCNLRCKYCVYNGHYFNRRQLKLGNMDFNTAKKGLDYLYSLVKDRRKKEFSLGFYGGEPMLNINTIRQVVEYGKKLFAGWELRLHMTSNLTLLDDDILDFLVNNNFLLLVSLDGGKDNHDAKRVFINGKGTFDIIYRNLEKMAGRFPGYFRDKVSFSTVHSKDLSLKELHRFFSTNLLVKDKRLRFTNVSMYDTDYFEEYPYDKAKYKEDFRETCSLVLEKLKRGEDLSGFENFLFKHFKGAGDSLGQGNFTYLASSCMFEDRLYLDSSGRFHICEKMNSHFPIGDVGKGFDFKRMAEIVEEFCRVVKTHCSNCNIRFLCKRCYVNLAGEGEFKLDPGYCKNQRGVVIRDLEKYIEYKEEGLL